MIIKHPGAGFVAYLFLLNCHKLAALTLWMTNFKLTEIWIEFGGRRWLPPCSRLPLNDKERLRSDTITDWFGSFHVLKSFLTNKISVNIIYFTIKQGLYVSRVYIRVTQWGVKMAFYIKKPFNINFSEDAFIYSILNKLFCYASLTVAAGCFYCSTTSANPQDKIDFYNFLSPSLTHVEVSSLSTHLKSWSIIG